jgi:hypothetical protein
MVSYVKVVIDNCDKKREESGHSFLKICLQYSRTGKNHNIFAAETCLR